MPTRIRKRKRDGVEYGNWCVPLASGKLVNLGTKDARLANKRAALALQGRWPDDVAADAARAAEPVTEVATEEVQQEVAETPVMTSGPSAPASPEHPAGGAGPADSAASGADAAAAAAEVAGADAAAAPVAGNELAGELQKVLSGIGGGAAEGVELAQVAAGLHIGAAYAIANLVARKMKPPRQVPDVDDKNILVAAATAAYRVELKKWFDKLDTIEPWHVLLAVTIAAPGLALLGSKPMEPKVEGSREGTTSTPPQG